MILIFSLIIITSIWTLGIKILISEDMALEQLGKWGEKKISEGHKIYEPLFWCHWCTPSIHTAIGFLFAFGIGLISHFTWSILFYYPLVAMGASLLNGLIWALYEKLNSEKESNISIKEAVDFYIESSIEEYTDDEIEYEDRVFNNQHN